MKRISAAGLALGAAVTLGAGGPARAADVNVAFIATLSGPAASLGKQLHDGFDLRIEQLGGKLGGEPAHVTVVDDELKPDVALTKMKAVLEGGHINFVVGPIFTIVEAAIFKPVIAAGAIYISPNAGYSLYAGKGCNPHFFATSYENGQPHSVSGQYATDAGYKRVFLLAPNYQAGHDALDGFKSLYKGTIVAEDYVPLTSMDFQSELAKIAEAKPDAIYAFLPGGLGINFVKQFYAAGLNHIPFLSAFTVDESVLPAEGDAAIGLFGGADWAPDLDNPTNKAFVAAFEAKYHYVPASYAAQAYDTASLIDAAVREAGGADNADKVAAAMEKADFKSVRGKFRFNTNHYPIQDFYLTKVVKQPDGKLATSIVKTVLTDNADNFASQCPMK
jgi:branched-chain amino acid transport system substrate-binding protein